MRKLSLALAAVAGMSGCVVHEYRDTSPAVNPVNPSNVPGMIQAGYPDNEILALIQENGVTRKPTADDLVELKRAGVSDSVLGALVEAPVRQASGPVERRTREVYYCDPDPVIFGAALVGGYLWGRHIRRPKN